MKKIDEEGSSFWYYVGACTVVAIGVLAGYWILDWFGYDWYLD